MANPLTRLLSLPLTLVSYIVVRILRLIQRTGRFTSIGYHHPGSENAGGSNSDEDDDDDVQQQHIVDPTAASKQFVNHLSRRSDAAASSETLDSAMWCTQGGYNGALKRAKEEHKILLVVLLSRQHQDARAFLNQTLLTPSFVSLINEHRDSVLLWGGDVCTSRDAHIAAAILEATTFPFLAFLSQQPLPQSRLTGSASSSLPTKITVFSRLEGLAQTSLPSLRTHLTETVIPRLSPFLTRLRGQKREREQHRRLREEQDKAYAESAAKDLARVRAKEAELLAQKEAAEKQRLDILEKEREVERRASWRKRTAASFGPEAAEGSINDTLRLVIRLPDGKRLVRRFAHAERAERIWELVECEANGVPISSINSTQSKHESDDGYRPDLSFTLASTFPRRVMTVDQVKGKTIGNLVLEGSVDKGVGNLIVEGLTSSHSSAAGANGNDEDEEEEEEEEED